MLGGLFIKKQDFHPAVWKGEEHTSWGWENLEAGSLEVRGRSFVGVVASACARGTHELGRQCLRASQ